MILCVPGVLSPEGLQTVGKLLSGCQFADGRATAGWHARLVKNNEQADAGDAAVVRAKELATAALARNDVLQSGVLPRTIRPFLFSRYAEGMAYGLHVDDAIMGGKDAMRSDVSLTLFVSEPESYGGGELIIETTGGEQPVKLPGGSAVAYPSTALHRVEAVTQGERMVGVT
jgi:PKHD-type hydroxylase